MRNIFTIAAVSVLSVTTAVAETAPSDVAFEDGSVMASLTGSAWRCRRRPQSLYESQTGQLPRVSHE